MMHPFSLYERGKVMALLVSDYMTCFQKVNQAFVPMAAAGIAPHLLQNVSYCINN